MRMAECCVQICCPLDTRSLFKKKKKVLASVWVRLNRFFIKIQLKTLLLFHFLEDYYLEHRN